MAQSDVGVETSDRTTVSLATHSTASPRRPFVLCATISLAGPGEWPSQHVTADVDAWREDHVTSAVGTNSLAGVRRRCQARRDLSVRFDDYPKPRHRSFMQIGLRTWCWHLQFVQLVGGTRFAGRIRTASCGFPDDERDGQQTHNLFTITPHRFRTAKWRSGPCIRDSDISFPRNGPCTRPPRWPGGPRSHREYPHEPGDVTQPPPQFRDLVLVFGQLFHALGIRPREVVRETHTQEIRVNGLTTQKVRMSEYTPV